MRYALNVRPFTVGGINWFFTSAGWVMVMSLFATSPAYAGTTPAANAVPTSMEATAAIDVDLTILLLIIIIFLTL